MPATIEKVVEKGNGKAPMPQGRMLALPKMDIRRLELELEGTSELIVHAWSEKAKKMILGKQTGKATSGKEPKDPKADYEGSMYRTPDGKPGILALGFKNAAVKACTSLTDLTKTAARQAFFVVGDVLPIVGKPHMREDMVRVGRGIADVRHRAGFWPWSVNIQVDYNNNALTGEEIVNLFNVAGFAVGVFEWRPERNGGYGRFKVKAVTAHGIES